MSTVHNLPIIAVDLESVAALVELLIKGVTDSVGDSVDDTPVFGHTTMKLCVL